MLPHAKETDCPLSQMIRSELSSAADFEELVEKSLTCIGKMIPCKRLAWIEWDSVFDTAKQLKVAPGYSANGSRETLNNTQTWKSYLPVYTFIWNWEATNPIRRRSYLTAIPSHQVAYRFASIESTDLILSLERNSSRFTEDEMHALKTAGNVITPLATDFHDRGLAVLRTSEIEASA